MSEVPQKSVSVAMTMALSGFMACIAFAAGLFAADYLDGRRAASAPRIGVIDSRLLLDEFRSNEAIAGMSEAELKAATAAWFRRFDGAVRALHEQHNLIIVDREMVAVGGRDVTDVVARALR